MFNIDHVTSRKLIAVVNGKITALLEPNQTTSALRRLHALQDLHKRLGYHCMLCELSVPARTHNTITITRQDLDAVYAD